MTEFELLAQAAASAANIPNVPLVIKLAEIGFGETRNAREQKHPRRIRDRTRVQAIISACAVSKYQR